MQAQQEEECPFSPEELAEHDRQIAANQLMARRLRAALADGNVLSFVDEYHSTPIRFARAHMHAFRTMPVIKLDNGTHRVLIGAGMGHRAMPNEDGLTPLDLQIIQAARTGQTVALDGHSLDISPNALRQARRARRARSRLRRRLTTVYEDCCPVCAAVGKPPCDGPA